MILVGMALVGMILVGMILVGMILVGMALVGMILVGMALMGVTTFAVLECIDHAERLEGRYSLALGILDHIEQPLFEGTAVRNKRVGVHH